MLVAVNPIYQLDCLSSVAISYTEEDWLMLYETIEDGKHVEVDDYREEVDEPPKVIGLIKLLSLEVVVYKRQSWLEVFQRK